MNLNTVSNHPHTTNPAWPSADLELLSRVDQFLQAGKTSEALALVPGSGSEWVRNARAVCLLRAGRASQAIDALRELVFGPSSLVPRPDADPVFLANFAVALLLDGNPEGFHGILADIRNGTHPSVVKLKDAVRRWRAGMSYWQRARFFLGGGPPLKLDFPPGDL
jgi:hypothetical protein